MEQLLEFIQGTNSRFLLKGAAGTGKTTLIAEFIERIQSYVDVLICAPTHGTVNVLRDKGISPVQTLQSFLKLKMAYDADGARTFIPTRQTGQYKYNLIIIDECSMINEELLAIIEKHILCRVIFVGDEYQLPPVKETISHIFAANYPTLELTQIMRTNIHNDLYNMFRDAVIAEEFPDVPVDSIIDRSDIDSILAIYSDNPNTKLIAHSNKQVDKYNRLIIEHLFGNDEYYAGMRIVFKDHYKIQYEIFHVGTEVIIDNVKQIDVYHPWGEKFHVYKMRIYKIGSVHKYTIQIVCNDQLQRYNNMCNMQRAICANDVKKISYKKRGVRWAAYYELARLFHAPIKGAYASTAYGVQGDTCQSIIVDSNNIIYTARDAKYKCLYTAVTRGSHNIHIII